MPSSSLYNLRGFASQPPDSPLSQVLT
ncbi:hypothetical protein MY3296_002491 [Beauveria thailandica]